eukprot:TRINITY_DN1370_c0_g1_i3.p1 TRINITY_DN1370_c0_g1~~TRINITY_DN1370_c0_g1_i3.p1  ORF type:complete len:314 (+),score=95.70 TRINITY_DN1370_c0_g1_i3:53-943(+)
MALVRVLCDNPDERTVVAHARAHDGSDAVVTVSKTHFTEEEARELVEGCPQCGGALQLTQSNDKYRQYCGVQPKVGGLLVKQIVPATPADITKYDVKARAANLRVVVETPALYAAATEPYVRSLPASELHWIDNLMAGRSERETVLLETPDIVFVTDTKWDGVASPESSLYVLAIFRDPALRSIRDVGRRGESDIALLRRAADDARACIRARYGIPPSRVLSFVHYLPAFWRLHVHFVVLGGPRLGDNRAAGRALLLDDALGNLARDSQYYCAHAAMTIVVDNPDLLARYKAGAVI